MERKTTSKSILPFSVLFPEVHQLIIYALVRQFHALQLRCAKTLLYVCAERLTRYAVALPEHRGGSSALINIGELGKISEERIEALVLSWRNEVSTFDDPDVARVACPKVFEFVRDQILLKEPHPCYLSENDIAALTMLVLKATTVFYKNGRWMVNDSQIARTLECWFTVG